MSDISARAMTPVVELAATRDTLVEQSPAAIYLASLAPGSRRTMREALNTIAGMLGITAHLNAEGQDVRCLYTPWGQVGYAHVMAIRTSLAERYAPAMANKALSALRRVLREAFRLGVMEAESYQRAVLVPAVKGWRELRGRLITASEVVALMRVCADEHTAVGARDAAILAVLRGTGLRRAELANLDLADYRPEMGELLIRSGKGNKDRRVYAPSGTRAALEAWLRVRGDTGGALFYRAYKGGHMGTTRITGEAVAIVLRARAAEAGIPSCTPHDMRRTYISELLDAGADITTVQKLVGHEQVTTTASYDRRGEEVRRRAAELVHVPFFG